VYGVRLDDGGSLAVLSGASFFIKHLYCLLQLAFHSHMMHPNKLAHAAEERANGSRRAFLKYVFMEVRVPLNSIIMSLQILDHDEAVPEGSRETVAMMREAAQFMAQTLNDVFSMQKIEEGTFDIEYVF
jgi:signal transduction histidine kinase